MSEQAAEFPKAEIIDTTQEPKTEAPEISKKLKSDAEEKRNQGLNSFVHFIAAGAAGSALIIPGSIASIASDTRFSELPPGLAIPYTVGMVAVFGSMCKLSESGYKFNRGDKIEKAHSIENSDPAYVAQRLIYRGEDIDLDGTTLSKGDNFYFVKLPTPRLLYSAEEKEDELPESMTPEQLELLSQYYSLILKDLKNKVSQRDFQALVLDFGFVLNTESPLLKRYQNAAHITKDKIFEGKNLIETPAKDSTTLAIPREFLEAMPLNPNDIFNKAIDALELEIGDKITGRELLANLRNLGSHLPDERQEKAVALRKKLDNLFSLQAESMFNTFPDVSIEKTPLGPIRTKSQIHPMLQIKVNPKGVFLEEVAYSKGERRSVVKLDMPIEDVLVSNSKNKILLLSFALSEMLSTPEKVLESTEENIFTPDEIRNRLRRSGISLGLPLKLTTLPKSIKLLKGARDVALAGIIGIGATSALDDIPAVVELPHIINIELSGGQNGNENINLNRLESKEKTSLGSYPESHLDWRTTEYGLSASGYYITSTSSEYENGGWLIDNKSEEAEILDTTELSSAFWSQQEKDMVRLQGVVGLDFFKNARFRIPIKEGTSLNSFHLFTMDHKDINPNSYSVYKFKDGTYMIDISLDKLSSSTAVIVNYDLIESEEGPHAIKRIESIDTNKLSPEALNLLTESENTLEGLRTEVTDKPYSIDPPNKNVLNDVDESTEAWLNAMVELDGSDCDTSNTTFALLSSTIATPSFVNTASGYSGINGRFLNNNRSHRFNLNNEGQVVDATASDGLLGDELTKEYIDSLNNTGGNSESLPTSDDQWSEMLDAEKQKEQIFGNLQLLLELSGLAAALVITPRGIDKITKKIKKEKIVKIKNRAKAFRALRRLDLNDMQEAYRFFNWMSYGSSHEFPQFSEVNANASSREELADRIKKGVMQNNLQAYLRNPKDYESRAGIKHPRRLRRIARYLIS